MKTNNFLTKSRLDQYIKDGELVPIGTKLITVQLGECEVYAHNKGRCNTYIYECRNENERKSYDKDFRLTIDNVHTSLIDPTHTTVESPFSNLELSIIRDDVFGSLKEVTEEFRKPRRQIINKIDNHLLTAANEWPKMMYAWDNDENDGANVDIIYIDPLNRFVVEIGVDGEVAAWKHARPIPPKPKELKDLKEGDDVYVVGKSLHLMFGDKYKLTTFLNALVVRFNDSVTYDLFCSGLFSPYPPTPAQIANARKSAIDEVNKRFDEMEVGNG